MVLEDVSVSSRQSLSRVISLLAFLLMLCCWLPDFLHQESRDGTCFTDKSKKITPCSAILFVCLLVPFCLFVCFWFFFNFLVFSTVSSCW